MYVQDCTSCACQVIKRAVYNFLISVKMRLLSRYTRFMQCILPSNDFLQLDLCIPARLPPKKQQQQQKQKKTTSFSSDTHFGIECVTQKRVYMQKHFV
jgi:hypothetical protein